MFVDVGKKKGQVQVVYIPVVWLRQSLVLAAGGKGDVETIARGEREDVQDAG